MFSVYKIFPRNYIKNMQEAFDPISLHAGSAIPPFFLKIGPHEEKQTGLGEKEAPGEDDSGGAGLLCRRCLSLITSDRQRISVNGAHCHTFANPHGIVFEIGCFRNAAGCGTVGKPTSEFTWFAGYQWRIAVCGACLTHMGWRFDSASGPGFYGLILDCLVESDAGPDK